MYRTVPQWYREGIAEVLIKFSSLYSAVTDKPANLFLLPSFASPKLEADGVHLDPYSGLQYVLHLFDSAQAAVLRKALPVEDKVAQLVDESFGVESRLSSLEQDHARLNSRFERQVAHDAELLDIDENIRNESFFMIQGLPRLTRLDPKEWNARARADVDRVLREMGFEHTCQFVQNSTGKGKDSKTLYKAKVKSAEVSREIRDRFGRYFAGGNDSRPESLRQITIRNCVTPATLGRVAILQLLGKRYRESNPGSRVQVIAYESRPLLKLTPPPGASDKRVQSFTFIEAVTKLPTNFSQDEIDGLLKRISSRLHSNLRSLFIVLNEDMVKKFRKPKKSADSPPSGSESTPGRSGDSSSSGRRRKRGPQTPGTGPSSKK